MTASTEFRILVVDDNAAIHGDFQKILAPPDAGNAEVDDLEAALLGTPLAATAARASFELVSAFQGREALDHVVAAAAAQRPFALAFVDMRMPPGWDGLETIERIWRVAPQLQIVICSAYSDHSWDDVRARLGVRESLLILKKPFDTIELVQCAHAMTRKWMLGEQLRAHVDALEATVASRTSELVQANAKLADEIRTRERVEVELRLSQKLEAVGQLAAGIAHEINTPIQYVGDNLQFLREGMVALSAMATEMIAAATDEPATATLAARIAAIAADADVDYLIRELPGAFASIGDGIARIGKIVGAMKDLAHPGPREATHVDLARTLQNALEVTAATYRYVADVELDVPVMPHVVCYGSEIGQVFINLIVNAAHAMEAKHDGRGRLGVRSRIDGGDAVIEISDTGIGIPETIRHRIFDAFFTTKDVGRGTGQGLAISRSIVVDRHGGTLTCESTMGVGTTFRVRIPVAGPAPQARSITKS